MKYKLPAACVLAAMLLMVVPQPATAHTVGFDDGFKATLHFSPADDPVAALPLDMRFIDIKDQAGKFMPENCLCSAFIYQGKRHIADITLKPLGPDLAGRVTFPTAGEYQVVLKGQPKTAAAFDDFEIRFPLRIDKSAATDTAAATYAGIGAVLALLIMIGLVTRKLLSKGQA